MDYYVTKKAGSILCRSPHKRQFLAGDCIDPQHWDKIGPEQQRELLDTGMVEAHEGPETYEPSDAPPLQGPRVGVGKDGFMPEARVQRGERVDAKLEQLRKEQEQRDAEARKASEVDPERGGSRDGVVRVELPPEEDEDDQDDYDDSLTEEERHMLMELDAQDQEQHGD